MVDYGLSPERKVFGSPDRVSPPPQDPRGLTPVFIGLRLRRRGETKDGLSGLFRPTPTVSDTGSLDSRAGVGTPVVRALRFLSGPVTGVGGVGSGTGPSDYSSLCTREGGVPSTPWIFVSGVKGPSRSRRFLPSVLDRDRGFSVLI